MHRLCVLTLGLLFSCTAAAADCFPEVVWLVRHAEKEAVSPDPPLTERGTRRARALAEILGPENPQRIYSSDYRRTRSTVEPLSKQLGLALTIVDAADVEGLVREVLEQCRARLLVAGHSNTVPALIAGLGVTETVVIDEASGYGDLFEVRWSAGQAQLQRRRFGD